MGRAVHGGAGCRRVSVGISERRVLVLAEWRAEEWVFRACAHRRVADRAMEAGGGQQLLCWQGSRLLF